MFLLSILGAILPIFPGFVFFFIGIILLSWIIPNIRKHIENLLDKNPKVKRYVMKIEKRLKKIFKQH